jgi:hypothetical protein
MASIVETDLGHVVDWQELNFAGMRRAAKKQCIKARQRRDQLSTESMRSIEIYALSR